MSRSVPSPVRWAGYVGACGLFLIVIFARGGPNPAEVDAKAITQATTAITHGDLRGALRATTVPNPPGYPLLTAPLRPAGAAAGSGRRCGAATSPSPPRSGARASPSSKPSSARVRDPAPAPSVGPGPIGTDLRASWHYWRGWCWPSVPSGCCAPPVQVATSARSSWSCPSEPCRLRPTRSPRASTHRTSCPWGCRASVHRSPFAVDGSRPARLFGAAFLCKQFALLPLLAVVAMAPGWRPRAAVVLTFAGVVAAVLSPFYITDPADTTHAISGVYVLGAGVIKAPTVLGLLTIGEQLKLQIARDAPIVAAGALALFAWWRAPRTPVRRGPIHRSRPRLSGRPTGLRGVDPQLLLPGRRHLHAAPRLRPAAAAVEVHRLDRGHPVRPVPLGGLPPIVVDRQSLPRISSRGVGDRHRTGPSRHRSAAVPRFVKDGGARGRRAATCRGVSGVSP